MAEGESNKNNQETKRKIQYEKMKSGELVGNMLYELYEFRAKRRIIEWRAKHIKELRKQRQRYEKTQEILNQQGGPTLLDIIRNPQLARLDNRAYREKLKDAGEAIGKLDPAMFEKKPLLTADNKSYMAAVGTLLWAGPLMKSASKFDKRWEGAKRTLSEPFSKKALGDLFKNIGNALIKP